MRKLILLFITVSAIAVVLGIIVWTKQRSCRGIKCLHGKNLTGYKLEEIYQDDRTAFRGLYRKGDTLLRFEAYYNIPKGQIDERIASTIARLKGLYERSPAPYPGEVSDEIRCDNTLAPVVHKQTEDFPTYAEIYLNDRLSYGVCDNLSLIHI